MHLLQVWGDETGGDGALEAAQGVVGHKASCQQLPITLSRQVLHNSPSLSYGSRSRLAVLS